MTTTMGVDQATFRKTYEESTTIVVEKLTVFLNFRSVVLRDKEIKLSKREYELFVYLLVNRNRYVPKDELNFKVWGMQQWKKENKVAEVYIGYLRKKMPGCIKTFKGVGFGIDTSSFL